MSISSDFGNVAAGAGTGAAVGGPLGAAIGGGVGVLTSLFSDLDDAEERERLNELIEQAQQGNEDAYNEVVNRLDNYYSTHSSIGTAADVTNYRDLINNYDPNEFVYDYGEFNDDFDVNDYYAANKDAIIDATANKLQSTAAGAGIGRGTGAANSIATGVAEKNEDLYKDALAAMQEDRAFAYNKYQDSITNAQNKLNAQNQNKQYQITQMGNLAQDYQDWDADKFQAYLDAVNNRNQNNLNIITSQL